MTSTLAALFEHNCRANGRLLEACRDFTNEPFAELVAGSYGDLASTLAHIASGDSLHER